MRQLAVLIVALSLFAAFGVLSAEPKVKPVAPEVAFTLPASVLSIHDGDTLKVRVQFEMDIRMIDCWAPEVTGKEKPLGIISREHLRKLAEGKDAVVHIPLTSANIGKLTSMSRVLGRVYVDGVDLSEYQVTAGHAARTKPEELKMLEGK